MVQRSHHGRIAWLPLTSLALGGALLLHAGTASAAGGQKLDCSQPLPSAITVDTEVTGAGGADKTCTVPGRLVVQGATLTIDPGVTLVFGPDGQNTPGGLIVKNAQVKGKPVAGILVARGTVA